MSKMIFVNLPVRDLPRSREFFSRLGFTFNEQFCDDQAAALVIDDENGIYSMLMVEPFFKTFTNKEIGDTSRAAEVIVTLGLESRAAVDELADKALAAGAEATKDPMDEGFMYGRSFQDLDGHLWEIMWMDPAAVQEQPSA